MPIARLLVALFCCTIFLSTTQAIAREVRTELRRGVTYIYDERQEPAQRIFAVVIELDKSGAQIDVAGGGPDPDGEGPWQTVLKPVPTIAKNEGFDIAVNGDFFSHLSGKDAEGAAALKEFKGGTPASVSGAAVSDGKVWSRADNKRPAFVVTNDGGLSFHPSDKIPEDTEEAIAGSDVLVKDGKDVATREGGLSKTRHPRTVVGFKDDGKTLVLLVVDGRKKDVASGMTFEELAAEMLKLGCEEAVNLDGGGSSTLVFRDSRKNEFQVMNDPSDGRPRSVANALGVTFRKSTNRKNR